MVRTALVTGGNRGIGRAFAAALGAAGLDVVLTARRGADAAAAAAEVGAGCRARVTAHELDLADRDSVRRCAAALRAAGTAVDVLVNNGGVLGRGDALHVTPDDLRAAVDVNLLGAHWCCEAFVPAMIARGHGRVVNVSSGWGSFAEGLGGPASYSVTKAALNALTVVWARAVADARGGADVKVNAISPGWVRTRMGGDDAELSPEQSAAGMLWLATLPADGPSGGFFRGRDAIGW